jgi:acyl-coenzyme A thioesterase PaaI-like protein
MKPTNRETLGAVLESRMRGRAEGLVIPPPAFVAMQGEFLEFDEPQNKLTARFPVLEEHLNPFGTLQGGFLAAAIDNTVGPLSLLVAPPSVTRRLEIKYRRAVSPDDEFIRVVARLVENKRRRLRLEVSVVDPRGVEVASGHAIHWVIDPVDGS